MLVILGYSGSFDAINWIQIVCLSAGCGHLLFSVSGCLCSFMRICGRHNVGGLPDSTCYCSVSLVDVSGYSESWSCLVL